MGGRSGTEGRIVEKQVLEVRNNCILCDTKLVNNASKSEHAILVLVVVLETCLAFCIELPSLSPSRNKESSVKIFSCP